MKRRDFITLVGAAVALPFAARAQSQQMPRIGVLVGGSESDPQSRAGVATFAKALAELGWTDGRNIRIDYRWGHADIARIQTLAKELVGLAPALIVGVTTQVVAALQRETKTIPIVFAVVSDPVGSGFVTSLPRPGGNTTGFINLEASLSGKWIETLKEIAPHTTHAALLYNPQTATYFQYYLRPFESAARQSAIEPIDAPVGATADIENVFTSLAGKPDGGLVVMPDVFTGSQRNYQLMISLAARYRVPAIYPYRYMVDPGGLIS